jgi:hypothetical protein
LCHHRATWASRGLRYAALPVSVSYLIWGIPQKAWLEASLLLYRVLCLSQGCASYSKPARSAMRLRMVREVPPGRYIPLSHSLIVCCRVPNSPDSCYWVRPRWSLNAFTLSAFHWLLGVLLVRYSIAPSYTVRCKHQRPFGYTSAVLRHMVPLIWGRVGLRRATFDPLWNY